MADEQPVKLRAPHKDVTGASHNGVWYKATRGIVTVPLAAAAVLTSAAHGFTALLEEAREELTGATGAADPAEGATGASE